MRLWNAIRFVVFADALQTPRRMTPRLARIRQGMVWFVVLALIGVSAQPAWAGWAATATGSGLFESATVTITSPGPPPATATATLINAFQASAAIPPGQGATVEAPLPAGANPATFGNCFCGTLWRITSTAVVAGGDMGGGEDLCTMITPTRISATTTLSMSGNVISPTQAQFQVSWSGSDHGTIQRLRWYDGDGSLLHEEVRGGTAQGAWSESIPVTITAHTDPNDINVTSESCLASIGGDGGSIIYDNSTSANVYFPPPDQAVPVDLGMAVVYSGGASGSIHVDNITFGYATNVPDNGMGPIEVIITFYGGLNSDDSPDTTNVVAQIDIPGLPGATSQGNGYIVGPVDLAGAGVDFEWPASTFNFDGMTMGNWVAFQYQQTGTGPIVASGATLLSAFWTDVDLNSPYEAGSFFWQFNGGTPNAFYFQIGGTNDAPSPGGHRHSGIASGDSPTTSGKIIPLETALVPLRNPIAIATSN